MFDIKKKNWEESFSMGENFIFYTKEETVKFINRFIKKKKSYNQYTQILESSNKLRALDFGCGIGRMTILLKEFENKFSKYCNTKYAIATSSCTSALEICLSSLNLKTDDEVIVPVQTFIATGSSVLKTGAKIVFCDVDQNFLLDFKCLKNLITKKIKVVIIVHFAAMISENIIKIKNFLEDELIKI